jgi:protein-S-isoprenylcysteine O-methyltransferase Ste14
LKLGPSRNPAHRNKVRRPGRVGSAPVGRAAWGSLLFFVAAPGVVAGGVPWLVTRYDDPGTPVAVVLGSLLVALGLAALVACFVRFVREGRGTPAPVAPTHELVVGGLYRWVRNPMYLAVGAIILGQAVIFTSAGVLVWLACFAVAVVTFVTAYEEPTLRETHGESYDDYRAAVPGWLPRLSPWRGGASSGDTGR